MLPSRSGRPPRPRGLACARSCLRAGLGGCRLRPRSLRSSPRGLRFPAGAATPSPHSLARAHPPILRRPRSPPPASQPPGFSFAQRSRQLPILHRAAGLGIQGRLSPKAGDSHLTLFSPNKGKGIRRAKCAGHMLGQNLELNRRFSGEDTHMAHRCVKRCSTSLTIREVRIKTALRNLTSRLLRWLLPNRQGITNAGEDTETTQPSARSVGM